MGEEPYHRGKDLKDECWKEVQKRLSGAGCLRDHMCDEAE